MGFVSPARTHPCAMSNLSSNAPRRGMVLRWRKKSPDNKYSACFMGFECSVSHSENQCKALSWFSISRSNTSPGERFLQYASKLIEYVPEKRITRLTLFVSRYQDTVELFGCSNGAHSPSLQQSLQGTDLPRLVLAGQAGATTRGVHSTRLSLTESARHAAAAAGLPHPLPAVLRQWLALQESPGVALLATHHRPHGAGEPGEGSQRGGQTKHTESGHSAD